MPTFKVTDPDTGRTVRLTGDSPPTEKELNQIFSQLNKQPAAQPGILGKRFTPQEVEQRISQQPDVLRQGVSAGLERFVSPGAFLQDPLGAKASIQVLSGLIQRGVAGVVNPLLEAQKRGGLARFESPEEAAKLGVSEAEFRADKGATLKQIGLASLKGITGERLGEAGDIFRVAGVPDRAAAALGLVSEALVLEGVTKLAKGTRAVRADKAINQQIAKAVDKPFAKAVRPSLKRKTAAGLARSKQVAREGIESIVDNKENLRFIDDITGEVLEGQLPKNLNQTSQAVSQTKTRIFSRYSKLREEAGAGGKTISTDPVIKELQKKIDDWVTKTANRPLVKYAQQWIDDLRAKGTLTLQEADDLAKTMNVNLDTFFKGRNPLGSVTSGVDEIIRRQMNTGLDDVVKATTGEAFRALKQKYSALRSIEDDIAKAAKREFQQGGGLVGEAATAAAAAEIAGGVVTGRVDLAIRGLFLKAAASVNRFLNKPSRAIEKIFREVEKIKTTDAKKALNIISETLKRITLRTPEGAFTTGRAILKKLLPTRQESLTKP